MAKLKYNDDFPLLAEDFARKGMKDKEIATNLGISEDAFYRYQKMFKEFYEALKRGKAPVDVEVENALLKRARGYEYEETTVEFKPGKKDDEKAKPVKVKKVTKKVIPDTTAQIFWLKNRRPKDWRDKHEHIVGGSEDLPPIRYVPVRGEEKKEEEKRDGI